MSRKADRCRTPRRQRGQSMIEYVVVCAVLSAALFGASPVGKQLAQGVRTFYADLSLVLSLP